MSQPLALKLNINGVECESAAESYETLLTLLRDRLALTGTKRGCNHGVCGACTVLSDGRPVRACLSLAHNCGATRIETIEGLGGEAIVKALHDAFIAAGAFQCGFCTPGMVVSAFALLRDRPSPSEDEVRGALSGNLCRCTGYRRIIEAVLRAANDLREQAGSHARR